MSKQIFKTYSNMSIIHVKMNSLIMQATREVKSVLSIVELGQDLVVSSFVMKEDICSCFLVGDPYCDLKLEHLQQGELNKDLRASFIFQQREFDAVTSSLFKFFDMLVDLEIVLGWRLGGKMRIKIWAKFYHGSSQVCKGLKLKKLWKGSLEECRKQVYAVAYGTLCRSMTMS